MGDSRHFPILALISSCSKLLGRKSLPSMDIPPLNILDLYLFGDVIGYHKVIRNFNLFMAQGKFSRLMYHPFMEVVPRKDFIIEH